MCLLFCSQGRLCLGRVSLKKTPGQRIPGHRPPRQRRRPLDRHPPWQRIPRHRPPDRDPPLGRDPRDKDSRTVNSGRYASCWNAFLYWSISGKHCVNLKRSENHSTVWKYAAIFIALFAFDFSFVLCVQTQTNAHLESALYKLCMHNPCRYLKIITAHWHFRLKAPSVGRALIRSRDW